ncbi:MAG: FAD-dependent oxidoreductase [Anaerolineae bacterium]|nr:FAD-dependent oxidoreductase [Anaerolineae bacterium]MCB9104778.1 FAD-dependent oxidoreductase [Anaerolineales bacterium]
MTERLVIVGGVAAGMSAATRARRINKNLDITVYEKTGYVSYGACGFPYFIKGDVPEIEALLIRSPQEFAAQGIEVLVQHEITAIDPAAKTVQVTNLRSGRTFTDHWDRLILATGGQAVPPPLPGIDLNGVFTLRTVEDALAIKCWIKEKQPQNAVIIGGGYIGLEMAEAFSAHGIRVTIVEAQSQILPTIDADMAVHIEQELRAHNIELYLGHKVKSLDGDAPLRRVIALTAAKVNGHDAASMVQAATRQARVRAVLTSGAGFPAEMVIVGTGTKPAVEFARAAGVEIGLFGAIRVNNRQQTNVPDIYAAGAASEVYHRVAGQSILLPLATTASKQGRVAGTNAAGGRAHFSGIVGTAVVKMFDLQIAQTGLTEKYAKYFGFDARSATISATAHAHYMPGNTPIHVKLVYETTTQRLLGAQIIGKEGVAKRIDVIAAALHSGLTVYDLAELDLSYAPPFAPVWDPILVAANVASK